MQKKKILKFRSNRMIKKLDHEDFESKATKWYERVRKSRMEEPMRNSKRLDENEWKYGKVIRVGKPKGRDKNACWVLDKNNVEKKINFATEVEDWKYVTVKFSDDTQNNNTSNTTYNKIIPI